MTWADKKKRITLQWPCQFLPYPPGLGTPFQTTGLSLLVIWPVLRPVRVVGEPRDTQLSTSDTTKDQNPTDVEQVRCVLGFLDIVTFHGCPTEECRQPWMSDQSGVKIRKSYRLTRVNLHNQGQLDGRHTRMQSLLWRPNSMHQVGAWPTLQHPQIEVQFHDWHFIHTETGSLCLL